MVPRTGSRALSLIILNSATAKVSATSCSAIVFRYQRLSERIESKRSFSFAGIGYVRPSRRSAEVAAQHFVVARLVQHLGGLEELLVGALHDVHHLAAGQQGALLAVHQDREPPGGDATVQRDAVGLRQALPERAAVDVDQLVRDHAPVRRKRVGPGNVLGGIPLIALGVLVESPHVGLGDAVLEGERRRVRRGDREGFHWGSIAECYRGRHDAAPRRDRRSHVHRGRPASRPRARSRGRLRRGPDLL